MNEKIPRRNSSSGWDYLIITAANEQQAAAYRIQLELRKSLGLITGVKTILVIPDPGGRRIGSGSSTLLCLMEVLSRELRGRKEHSVNPASWENTLGRLRILIIHAGGDARRLPAYSPCGKIFIPVPGESDSALAMTLLDRQLPRYLDLPPAPAGAGQILVTTGDVILSFDSSRVRFQAGGTTGIGSYSDPKVAKDHGVFCPGHEGKVRRFLQKPSVEEQERQGAVDLHGRSILDIGIMNLDAASALRLLEICDPRPDREGRLIWSASIGTAFEKYGVDFYREICCAMGEETAFASYRDEVRKSGSALDDETLKRVYRAASRIPFHVEIVPRCGFLHFGTMRQLIESGAELAGMDSGVAGSGAAIALNNEFSGEGMIAGRNAWVEGCRIRAGLTLQGENVVIGADVEEPLTLPAKACLDVLEGRDRRGKKVWFVRCYGIDDVFHRSLGQSGRLCGLTLEDWLRAMEASGEDIWDADLPEPERNVWNGRLFPAEGRSSDFSKWLWLFKPEAASREQKHMWRRARRYSLSDIARLASHEAFHSRRTGIRTREVRRSYGRIFRLESGFSAADLSFLLRRLDEGERREWILEILKESYRHFGRRSAPAGLDSLGLSRILHTLGTALRPKGGMKSGLTPKILDAISRSLTAEERAWLDSLGISPEKFKAPPAWATGAQKAAFAHLGRVIVFSGDRRLDPPKNSLREDEIVWGRAPARLDLGGGWTDTPPYALERGGCVINAAVDLNGQSPIQAYGRVIREPEIRISSIDHGARVVVRELEDLLDYRKPTSRFGLAKAALALCGFSPATARWPKSVATLAGMLERFGGGIELTTLAAIPSGSGLGTSSIMGAVLMSVISRVLGRTPSYRELFHGVLQLEQELTTGGGWQDQIGGVVDGVKVIRTEPGLIADPQIHFVPGDVLDPEANHGQTVLYYTGLRRLAKNILSEVVGHYLDRDRASIKTLRDLHAYPPVMAEAMARKSIAEFGGLIDYAWSLNKRLDPECTTPVIEDILSRVGSRIFGAKLLGAGAGGFLLMVCRSLEDAAAVRRMLEAEPPNARARFFDYSISREGLVVTVC